MKEVKTERKVYDIHYEAIDGTIFYSKEECEKYDNTAKAVIRSYFMKLVVAEGTEYSFLHVGSDDNTTYAVKMRNENDANVVKQLWEIDHDYLHNQEHYLKYQTDDFTKIDTACAQGDILFVGEDYESNIYIIDTRANIIESLQNIDKKKDDSERK